MHHGSLSSRRRRLSGGHAASAPDHRETQKLASISGISGGINLTCSLSKISSSLWRQLSAAAFINKALWLAMANGAKMALSAHQCESFSGNLNGYYLAYLSAAAKTALIMAIISVIYLFNRWHRSKTHYLENGQSVISWPTFNEINVISMAMA